MNAPVFPKPSGSDPGVIRINEADGDVVIIRDKAGDDVEVDVSIRQENGQTVIEIDLVAIEECGRDNRPPPPAKAYKVRIDRKPYVFETRFVTGHEILERAGKIPVTRFELEKRVHGGRYVPIGLDQKVDLGECGIEAFETFPLDETEG